MTVQRLPNGAVVSIASAQIVSMHQPNSGQSQVHRTQITGQTRPSLVTASLGHKAGKTPTLVNVSQTPQIGLRLSSQNQQQVTIQRLITPTIAQQGQQTFIQRISNPNVLSQQINSSVTNLGQPSIIRPTAPIGTATILAGQQISLKPSLSNAAFITPSTAPVSLTVTSISPGPVLSSTSSICVGPQVVSTNNRSGFTVNPGQVLSQSQMLRPGVPILLNLPGGQQQVIQSGVSQMSSIGQKSNNFTTQSSVSLSVPVSQLLSSVMTSQTMVSVT